MIYMIRRIGRLLDPFHRAVAPRPRDLVRITPKKIYLDFYPIQMLTKLGYSDLPRYIHIR